MKTGKFTGIGVGPGDPELMTIKALRGVEEADILVLPAKDKDSCRAYRIAKAAFEAVGKYRGDAGYAMIPDGKECICVPFPMSMDKEELHDFHKNAAGKIAAELESGKNAAFLTIGDPAIYSTLDYIAVILEEMGYNTERISGVTSFCAAADRLGISLAAGDEPIHIIPGGLNAEEALGLSGTEVFMKGGRQLCELKDRFKKLEKETGRRIYGVSNCGFPDENLIYGADSIPDDWGYMSVTIVK